MNIERAVRIFVRTNFGARVRKIDGEMQTEVKGKTGRVLIQNPRTVENNLIERCGRPVEEKGNVKTFLFKEGKGKNAHQAKVSLVTRGEDAFLKVEDVSQLVH